MWAVRRTVWGTSVGCMIDDFAQPLFDESQPGATGLATMNKPTQQMRFKIVDKPTHTHQFSNAPITTYYIGGNPEQLYSSSGCGNLGSRPTLLSASSRASIALGPFLKREIWNVEIRQIGTNRVSNKQKQIDRMNYGHVRGWYRASTILSLLIGCLEGSEAVCPAFVPDARLCKNGRHPYPFWTDISFSFMFLIFFITFFN